MAKTKTKFVCQNCGYTTAKWWGAAPNAARGTVWQKNWKRRLPVRSKAF